MTLFTRSRLTSALTFVAPFGTDRVNNDLVTTEGGILMSKHSDAQRAYKARHPDRVRESAARYYQAHKTKWTADSVKRRRALAHTYRWKAMKFALMSNQRAKVWECAGRLLTRDVVGIVGPCAYCGGASTEWDHAIPLSRGGANHSSNLVRACHRCNMSKAHRTPEEWRAGLRVARPKGRCLR